RALRVRAIFGEREGGAMTLRRGFEVVPGERVLVVEDVTTTGGSVREIMQVAQERQGQVVGVGAILNRSPGQIDLGVPLHALALLQIQNYRPDACPLCQQGSQGAGNSRVVAADDSHGQPREALWSSGGSQKLEFAHCTGGVFWVPGTERRWQNHYH